MSTRPRILRRSRLNAEGRESASVSDSPPSAQPLPIAARRHPLVAEVRKRLIDRCEFAGGRLAVGAHDQAFPFITVDDQGLPHVALLSRSEIELGPGDLASFAGDAPHVYETLVPGTRALLVMDYP
jgi:hypothetical protein